MFFFRNRKNHFFLFSISVFWTAKNSTGSLFFILFIQSVFFFVLFFFGFDRIRINKQTNRKTEVQWLMCLFPDFLESKKENEKVERSMNHQWSEMTWRFWVERSSVFLFFDLYVCQTFVFLCCSATDLNDRCHCKINPPLWDPYKNLDFPTLYAFSLKDRLTENINESFVPWPINTVQRESKRTVDILMTHFFVVLITLVFSFLFSLAYVSRNFLLLVLLSLSSPFFFFLRLALIFFFFFHK